MRLIHSGPHSTVYADGPHAIKVVPSQQHEPHDVLREIKILSTLRFAHIVPLIRHELKDGEYHLTMPLYPLPLRTLLDSRDPVFADDQATRSLVAQMLAAVAHVHSQDIAHRDISPSNFAIGADGNLVLLDFGISIDRASTRTTDLCTDVGTGAYRPLELVYGDQQHDLRALDLWALGCTIAESFTPLIDTNAKTDSDSDSEPEIEGFRPPWMKQQRVERWRRQTLFEGRYGDIRLTGSVYKVLGTPTSESWPETHRMPTFHAMPFHSFPAQPLRDFLPTSSDDSIDLISQLLQIPASARTPAAQLLDHRYIKDTLAPGAELARLLSPWLK